MISDEEVEAISVGWIEEFSVEPYTVKKRDMEFFFRLSDLIMSYPEDALRVFRSIAQKELTDWVFEGISVGPLRTFLILYENEYEKKLSEIVNENSSFAVMLEMASEGM